jgi:AcrR family transcriptional regulator
MFLAKKTKKRQYKSKETRRKEILRAAARLFAIKGFSGTGVEDVVKAVGVSYGTFYYHFPSKMDLIQAFADSHIDKFMNRMAEWRDDPSVTPLAQIRRMMKMVERVRKVRLVLSTLRGGTKDEDPAIYQVLVSRIHGDLAKTVAGVIREGVEAGEFDCKNPDGAAMVMALLSLDIVHYAVTIKEQVGWRKMKATYEETFSNLLGIASV